MTDPIADIRARFAPLLQEAEGGLARREDQYPALVAAGRMDQQAAANEIRIWQAIVADWRHVVTGRGDRGGQVTAQEKIAVLVETVTRYNAALAKEIRGSSKAIQRDCVDGASIATLYDRHGDAIDSIMDIHRRRERIEHLRDWYREEQGGDRLCAGIYDYLAWHHRIRAARRVDQAA